MLRRGFLGSLAAFLGLGAGTSSAIDLPEIESAAAAIKSRKRFIRVNQIRGKYPDGLEDISLFIDLDSVCCALPVIEPKTGIECWSVSVTGGHKFLFPIKGNEHFPDALRQETLS